MNQKKARRLRQKCLRALLALRAFLPTGTREGPLCENWIETAMAQLRKCSAAQLRSLCSRDTNAADEVAQEVVRQTMCRQFLRRIDACKGTLAQFMSGVVRRTARVVATKMSRKPPESVLRSRAQTVRMTPSDLVAERDYILHYLMKLRKTDREALNIRFGGLPGMPVVNRPLTNAEGCRATRALARLRRLIARDRDDWDIGSSPAHLGAV